MTPKLESRRQLSRALYVIAHARRDGFWANIRGHVLELADPSDGETLAPTPSDLFIVSIAADLAWAARRILRAHELPDDVSVSANWRTPDGQAPLTDINLTVTVPRRAAGLSAALAAAFDTSLVARLVADPVVNISYEGANR